MRGRKPIEERFARERALADRMSQIGKRCLETMTPEQRRERAKKAVSAREAKRKRNAQMGR